MSLVLLFIWPFSWRFSLQFHFFYFIFGWSLLPKYFFWCSLVIKITDLNFFYCHFLFRFDMTRVLATFFPYFFFFFIFYQITWKLNLRACIHAFIHNDERDIVHLYLWKGWLSKAYLKNNGTIQEERKKERESELNRINSTSKLALWVKNYQTIRDKWPTKYHRRCCRRRVCRLFFEYWMLSSWKLALCIFSPAFVSFKLISMIDNSFTCDRFEFLSFLNSLSRLNASVNSRLLFFALHWIHVAIVSIII